MKRLVLIFVGLIFPLMGRTELVVITQSSPIEKLGADGRPCGVSMAQVGASFTLVSQDGGQVILKDVSGVQYVIAMQATNYSPPKAAPAPATPVKPTPDTSTPAASVQPATSAPPPAPAATVYSPPPVPKIPEGAPILSGEDAAKIKEINDALSLPLLVNDQFWQEDIGVVAKRLGWPQESKTPREESYRRYAKENQVHVLGASAYSLALYGKLGKPTYLSIIFANAGDFPESSRINGPGDTREIEVVKKDLAVVVKKDAETITSALTSLLGEPSVTLYGNSSSNREEVHRWDWNGVALLLNAHQGEYLSIKIVPTDVADRHGTVDVTERDEMRALLAQRVVKRANGDVIVSELPMVNQGPKGYCVPATWERYLRYMDLPADLYVLAILGDSGFGGGTNFERMQAGVNDYVSAYHRRIENYDAPLDVAHIAKYIDQGLPLMWTCWVAGPVEQQTNKNSAARKTVTDWAAYTKSLDAQDASLGPYFDPRSMDGGNGHMRLIIGYNATTDEIAISDSWGNAMAERWMPVKTALRISQGKIGYLSW